MHQATSPLISSADALLLMQIVETTVKGSSKKMDSMGQLIEAVLGQDLAHPNVVQTYKHTTRVAPQVCLAGWLRLPRGSCMLPAECGGGVPQGLLLHLHRRLAVQGPCRPGLSRSCSDAVQDDARLAAFRQQCGMNVQDCQEPRVMETWYGAGAPAGSLQPTAECQPWEQSHSPLICCTCPEETCSSCLSFPTMYVCSAGWSSSTVIKAACW